MKLLAVKVLRILVGLLGYLNHLHLLLPGVNALLQPPVFLLGLHVLSHAGSLVLGHLVAQTLVESLLPETLLRRDESGKPSKVLQSDFLQCCSDRADAPLGRKKKQQLASVKRFVKSVG